MIGLFYLALKSSQLILSLIALEQFSAG